MGWKTRQVDLGFLQKDSCSTGMGCKVFIHRLLLSIRCVNIDLLQSCWRGNYLCFMVKIKAPIIPAPNHGRSITVPATFYDTATVEHFTATLVRLTIPWTRENDSRRPYAAASQTASHALFMCKVSSFKPLLAPRKPRGSNIQIQTFNIIYERSSRQK